MSGCYDCLDIKETTIIKIRKFLKVPLLWVMKSSYLVLGVPNNRLTCMQGQKTLSLSYSMHLFFTLLAQRLPKDSLNDLFFQTPPLHDMMLICSDWSDWSHFHFIKPVMPDKAGLWEQCCFVQWLRVDSFFWESITSYTFKFKTLQDVFIHLELCYTLHERYSHFQQSIIGTLLRKRWLVVIIFITIINVVQPTCWNKRLYHSPS